MANTPIDEIVKEFLVESYENLDMLDRAMVELEKDPRHKASLDNVFRTIHTVKGTCGFLAFSRLEKLAHSGENLLSRIREGMLPLTSARTSGLLSMVDAIRHALATIEATGLEPQEDYAAIIQQLVLLTDLNASATAPEIVATTPVLVPMAAPAEVAPAPAESTADFAASLLPLPVAPALDNVAPPVAPPPVALPSAPITPAVDDS